MTNMYQAGKMSKKMQITVILCNSAMGLYIPPCCISRSSAMTRAPRKIPLSIPRTLQQQWIWMDGNKLIPQIPMTWLWTNTSTMEGATASTSTHWLSMLLPLNSGLFEFCEENGIYLDKLYQMQFISAVRPLFDGLDEESVLKRNEEVVPQ